MEYCVGVSRGNKEKNAGAKAPDDIIAICRDMGMQIYLIPTDISELSFLQKIYWKLVIPFVYWGKLFFSLNKGDKLLNQHPLANNDLIERIFIPLIQKKGVRTVALIHDLTSLRSLGSISEAEVSKLQLYDKVIVHNQSMKNYLSNYGFKDNTITILGIFDYLTDSTMKQKNESQYSITVAGNLEPKKSAYIYQMAERNPKLKVNLYGVGLDESNLSSNIDYKGSFSPEELVERLEGGFGLVWDGDSIEGCQGRMGEYLQFNNPHKTSLFIVSELPIISWSKAAIADFIHKHNIGITVDDLSDLTRVINEVPSDYYLEMKDNIRKLSSELKLGAFTKEAIRHAFEK